MNRIKELRTKKGLTQVQLAERAGVTQGQITSYETGKRRPRDIETWERIAEVLDVDTAWLMGLGRKEGTFDKNLRNHPAPEQMKLELMFLYESDKLRVGLETLLDSFDFNEDEIEFLFNVVVTLRYFNKGDKFDLALSILNNLKRLEEKEVEYRSKEGVE